MIRTRYIPKGVCHAELAYDRQMHCNLGPWWDVDTLSHDQSSRHWELQRSDTTCEEKLLFLWGSYWTSQHELRILYATLDCLFHHFQEIPEKCGSVWIIIIINWHWSKFFTSCKHMRRNIWNNVENFENITMKALRTHMKHHNMTKKFFTNSKFVHFYLPV